MCVCTYSLTLMALKIYFNFILNYSIHQNSLTFSKTSNLGYLEVTGPEDTLVTMLVTRTRNSSAS